MKLEQCEWSARGWKPAPPGDLADAQLVLLFGSIDIIKGGACLSELRKCYPAAHFAGCSTAGEIRDVHVSDDTLVVTAVCFDSTTVVVHRTSIGDGPSCEAGHALSGMLDKEGLVHVFVLSDGLTVNGSELVAGLTKGLPENVSVTGGLSADGGRFADETFVISNGPPERNVVTVLGFYGDQLRVGYGSMGGWDSFGPERLVTRSDGAVLYELDGKSALDLYKTYLGEHAAGLPGTGLLFPLSVRDDEGGPGLVRTILGIDEEAHSLTFAGDVPEGNYARLMKANFDRLVDGASGAAKTSYDALGLARAELAILISCVGRKMVLKQRVEEEVEAVRNVLGPDTVLTGFYSNGEIAPFTQNGRCELHNQTMTVTTFSEIKSPQ